MVGLVIVEKVCEVERELELRVDIEEERQEKVQEQNLADIPL